MNLNMNNFFCVKYASGILFIGAMATYILLSGYHVWSVKSIDDAEIKISELSLSIATLEKEKQQLAYAVDHLKIQDADLKSLIALQAEIQADKKAWMAQKREEEDLTKRVDHLLTNHAKYSSSLQQIKDEYDTFLSQLTRIKTELEVEGSRKLALTETESLLNDRRQQLSKVQRDYRSLEQSIEELKAEERKYKELMAKKNLLQMEVKDLEKLNDVKKMEAYSFQQNMSLDQGKLNALKQELKDHSKALDDLKTQQNSVHISLTMLTSDLEVKSAQKQELERYLTSARQEKNQWLAEVKDLEKKRNANIELTANIEQKSRQLHEKHLDLAGLSEKLAVENIRYQDLHERVQQKESEFSQCQLHITELYQQKNALWAERKKIFDQLKAEEKHLLEQKDNLEKQLNELEKRLFEASRSVVYDIQIKVRALRHV
jgi:chromosome segregation ATPase